MKTKWKVLIITLIVGIPAFLIGPMLWPPSTDMSPESWQLPFFIILSALEAVTLGLGVSFIIFGWPLVRKVERANRNSGWLLYIAIAWLLISWWPHDNLHAHNGMNMAGLLRIEYGFHFTLILATFIIAWNFFQFIRHYHPKAA